MFLKILKQIFLLLMLLLFIVSGVLLQTSLVLKNTLLAESYFSKSFEENDMAHSIVKLTTDALGNADKLYTANAKGKNLDDKGKPAEISPGAQKIIDSSKKMLIENIDPQWIQVEIPKTIKGLYGYFLSGSGKLPVINIKPVKETYVGIMVESIIQNSGSNALKKAGKTAAAVKDIIGKYSKDGAVNDKVIAEMMKLEQFKTMKISREATGRIAQKIAGSESIKSEEMLKYSAAEMIKDKIDYYQIKDELDLNLLFETKYGNKDNPVSGIAGLISTIEARVLLLVFVLFILLFLIIALTEFSARGFLRWSGVGLLLSGTMGIVANSFSGLVDSQITTNFNGLSQKAKGLDLLFAQKWILSYVNGVWTYILIQALIFVVMGIILIAASFYVHRFCKKSDGDSSVQAAPISKQKNALPMSLRVTAVLLLLIAIPLNAAINMNQIKTSVEQYNKTKEIAALNAKETNKALGIVLNAQKFMDMMQGEKKGSSGLSR